MYRPDLRDHILLSPSLYEPDAFALRFSKNVQFLWPSSMSNVYNINPLNGTYSYTDAFDTKFHDIGCWSLSSDFFTYYPQLIGIIPIYNAIPPSLCVRIPTTGDSDFAQRNDEFGTGLDAEGNISGFHTLLNGNEFPDSNFFTNMEY
jgi:Domain of unknown function (DUF3425)